MDCSSFGDPLLESSTVIPNSLNSTLCLLLICLIDILNVINLLLKERKKERKIFQDMKTFDNKLFLSKLHLVFQSDYI